MNLSSLVTWSTVLNVSLVPLMGCFSSLYRSSPLPSVFCQTGIGMIASSIYFHGSASLAWHVRDKHVSDTWKTRATHWQAHLARVQERQQLIFFWCNFSGLQHDTIHNRQPFGVPLKEKLLPEYLRQLGYSTHAVGKVICFDWCWFSSLP